MQDLIDLREKLLSEKQQLIAQVQPLRDEYNALAEQIAPLEARQRELAKQFHAIERPRLPEIESQLGALARALGARVLSQGEPQG